MQVFHAKYIGPTNYKGSRIKVSVLKLGQKIESKMIPYPYQCSHGEVYFSAVSSYVGNVPVGAQWELIQLAPCEYLVIVREGI